MAKLGDFGLARQLGGKGTEDGMLVSRIGTVTHMAPETIRDNVVGGAGARRGTEGDGGDRFVTGSRAGRAR